MRRPLASLALASLTLAALVGRPLLANAQDPGEVPSSGFDGGGTSTGLDLAQKRPYWSGGATRAFVSSTLEAGLVYYRPQLALGYGKPHWRWFGVETQARISGGSFAEYFGLRAALPNAELRIGPRYVFASNAAYLERAEVYTDDTIDYDDAPNARYLALESELSASLPVGDGAIIGTVGAYHLLGVPEEYDVFDQSLHVVVEPPWVGRLRAGYVHSFGVDDGLRLGFATEGIWLTEREAVVVRIGPQLGVSLTHHLDAALSVMAVVHSPDGLRLEGTDVGQFGFRYRWATGDRFPEFP